MAVILSQMFQHEPNALMGRLYLKAKVYELFSLYFNPTNNPILPNVLFWQMRKMFEKSTKPNKLWLSAWQSLRVCQY